MAVLTRFDDITDLYFYVNGDPAENTITKSGDTITELRPAYGAGGDFALTPQLTGTVSHNPATIQIDQLPAFYFPRGADNTAQLEGVMPAAIDPSEPVSMIALVQADDHTDAGMIVETNSASTTNHTAMGFANGPDVAYCRLLNSSRYSDLATTSGVHVVAVVWDHGTSLVPDMWLDKTKSGPIAAAGGPPSSTCAKITLGNRRQNSSNAFGGKIGIVALYAKALTEQEVFDLTDLCNTWAQTGAAPSPGETSGTFGVVETNDDANATFQWEESSNGTDWANVGTILTDISGATTNELTVNSATTSMDGTQVRARATDGVTTAYSNPATLTVVAQ